MLWPTWRASYGHRNILVCFPPNPSILHTRFLSCCSKNLQNSTLYYITAFLFFSRKSHRGSEFIFHCQNFRVYIKFGGTKDSIRITVTSEWYPENSGHLLYSETHLTQHQRDPYLQNFSDGYLCINNFNCMDPSNNNFCH